MNRSSLAAALAVVAVTALAGCASGGSPGTSGAPDAGPSATPSTILESQEPAESEPAPETTEAEPAAGSGVSQEQCEMVLQQRYQGNSPRLATEEDYATTASNIGFALPQMPTCGVVGVPESGTGTYTLHVYVDQPTVAPALTDGLSGQGWEMTQEQAAGYVIDVYSEGGVTAAVSPIGIDNGISAWGSIWPGMDVTLFGVEAP